MFSKGIRQNQIELKSQTIWFLAQMSFEYRIIVARAYSALMCVAHIYGSYLMRYTLVLVSFCFSISLCGFSNSLSFKSIGPGDIVYVQDFIKNDLLALFANTHRPTGLLPSDYVHFFGERYGMQTNVFQFSLGEIKLIEQLVILLNQIITERSLHCFKNEENKQRPTGMKRVVLTSVGHYFGCKSKHFAAPIANDRSIISLPKNQMITKMRLS